MSLKLSHKVAVVTGASSGLGKAIVERLSAEGVIVIALARTVEKIALPADVIKIVLNIRDLQSIDDTFKLIDNQTDKIDILVNCAGRGLTKNLEDTTREEIMDILGVNLKGNIYIAQEVYKRMLKANVGHIINVSSTTGLKARANEPIYAASKWGLRGFTESLRLAALEHNIRVTGIYPGGMQTAFWDNEATRDTSAFMKPGDVADVIIGVLKTPPSIAPTEYVIERGF
jgi:NADP-dependent 3-hydroxy acid dehydrogenase YdfG